MTYNKVILIGYLTKNPELKTTPSGTSVTAFSIGVSRRKIKDGGEPKTDFINIVAWRKTAEFITRFFAKGKPILVEGQLQMRSYDAKDGSKRVIAEVVADNVSFIESNRGEADETGLKPVPDATFEDVAAEDDLPF